MTSATPTRRRRLTARPATGLSQRLERAGDEGSISLFMVVMAAGLLIVVGLVVDGGGKIRALQRADAIAAEAAREGGQAIIAGPAVRGQGIQVDTAQARAAAETYLRTAGVRGAVQVTGGTRLHVTATTSYTPTFLGMIGLGPMSTTGSADVELRHGLERPQ